MLTNCSSSVYSPQVLCLSRQKVSFNQETYKKNTNIAFIYILFYTKLIVEHINDNVKRLEVFKRCYDKT